MPSNTVQDRTLLAGMRKRGAGQGDIQWLNATVAVGTPGQFTEINLDGSGFTTTVAGNRLTITFTGGGGAQAGIQFEDEGTPLGTPGTVDTLNFVGTSVTATRIGNVVTVTIAAGAGTVTSVGLALPASVFNVTGSPVTGSGTLTGAFATQSANTVFAGPTSGGAAVPAFRLLVAADLPAQSTQKAPGCIFTNGNLLLTGTLTDEIYIPYSGTITGWTILGDVSGSASIVVSNATYANYDTMSTLLTATCTTALKNQVTGLSIAVVAGALRFSGSGFSGFTRCSIVLNVQT